MNNKLRSLLVSCAAAAAAVVVTAHAAQPDLPQPPSPTSHGFDYQAKLRKSDAKSPLRPDGAKFMDLNKNGQMDPYEDPDLPIEQRIDDLLSKMNVEEKTNQCCTLYGYHRQ